MSMAEATGWSLLHACAVTVVTVVIARMVARWLKARPNSEGGEFRTSMQGFGWAILLAPLLTPTIVVGYAYANLSLALVRQPLINELLYVTLLTARLTPVAVLALYFAPRPPVSDTARYCARLVNAEGREPRTRMIDPLSAWSLWIRGSARTVALAAAIVFLLAFGDFQLASLMSIPAWTVWVFDAQAGGLDLSSSLGYAMLPGAIEIAVLALAVGLLRGGKTDHGPQHPSHPSKPIVTATTWTYLLIAAGIATAWPILYIGHDAWDGLSALTPRATVWSEVAMSMGHALPAATIALVAAVILVRRRWRIAAVAVSAPGLLGSLLLGLVILTLVQQLGPVYDTSLPMLAALVLLMMPVAVLVAVLLDVTRDREALFLARRIGVPGRGIVWRMVGRPRFWAIGLLFLLAVFDLGASYLLAPSGRTPVTVRLYNLMHYEQSAVLSAMVAATVLSILIVLLVARGLVGVTARLWSHRA